MSAAEAKAQAERQARKDRGKDAVRAYKGELVSAKNFLELIALAAAFVSKGAAKLFVLVATALQAIANYIFANVA